MIGLGWLYGLDLEVEANEREDHTFEILHEVVETPETKQIFVAEVCTALCKCFRAPPFILPLVSTHFWHTH